MMEELIITVGTLGILACARIWWRRRQLGLRVVPDRYFVLLKQWRESEKESSDRSESQERFAPLGPHYDGEPITAFRQALRSLYHYCAHDSATLDPVFGLAEVIYGLTTIRLHLSISLGMAKGTGNTFPEINQQRDDLDSILTKAVRSVLELETQVRMAYVLGQTPSYQGVLDDLIAQCETAKNLEKKVRAEIAEL